MIRHIVLVRFSPQTMPARIAEIFIALEALQASIPGILAISHGANASPEGLARGYTHAFTVDFVDAAARDGYLPHPEHGKVGKAIVAAAEGGIEGVAVIDYAM